MQRTLRAISKGQLRKRTAGFTLFEMIVVITVLLIIASAILPNLFGQIATSKRRNLEADIYRLPSDALNEATKTQNPVELRIENSSIIMEQAPANQEPIFVKQVDLGSDIQVSAVQLNDKSSEIGSWKWKVYPDGSSDTGGLEIAEGSDTKSLSILANAQAVWSKDVLPDASLNQWSAGQLAQRS